ncbi:unnamed protein product [Prorocentrum cordatum]|uniref:Reverse transcriptase Ty1/copia-type domain-containing protein n=1 Tax=Prorocentrum cordatum TaxID=2364126 RepID=A0ABN9U1T7_9DINO|nr:unnamed protein product [Polarella glacialis]
MATGNPNNLGEMIPLADAADEDLGLVLPAVFAEAAAGMPPPRPRPAHRPVLPFRGRGVEGRSGRGASSQAAPTPSAAAPVADASRADRSRTLLYAGADDEDPSAVGLDLTGELSRIIDQHAALETQTAILESEFQAKETALTERLEVALLERTEALSAQAHADLRSERGLMQRRLDEATAAAQHECHERLAVSLRELRAAEQQMAATDRQQLAGTLAAESAAYAAADQRRREECDAIHAQALRNLEAQRVELSAVVSTASSRLAAAGELEAAASRAEQQSSVYDEPPRHPWHRGSAAAGGQHARAFSSDARVASGRAAGPAAPAAPAGLVIQAPTVPEIIAAAMPAIMSGKYNQMLVELCCSPESYLSAFVPARCIAIRVTEQLDLTAEKTLRAVQDILKRAARKKLRTMIWTAVPMAVTRALITNVAKVCAYARDKGQDVTWEWPTNSDLWSNDRVHQLINTVGGKFVKVSASAVGQQHQHAGRVVYTLKEWTLCSTDDSVTMIFENYSVDEAADSKEFVRCRGKIAKQTAQYTEQFARLFWSARRAGILPAAPGVPRSRAFFKNTSAIDDSDDDPRHEHREHDDGSPRHPLWCALVTRQVWDTTDVHSLRDLLNDESLSDAMLGRVFAILGIKGEELGKDAQQWKARVVFQGSNIRSKSGMSSADLFEEVANAPASFAAARAALAAAALAGREVSLRGAEAAYFQALIDTPFRIPTYVELPLEWWPDSWFLDGAARQRPKYVRPHCRLKKALYGHPEAGALWEAKSNSILKQRGWEPAGLDHPGVHVHPDGGIFVVYVDDMLMIAPPSIAGPFWRALDTAIVFKEREQEIERYLGARYTMDPVNPACPSAARRLHTDMGDYVANALARFASEYGGSCASHVATLLFLSRVARPHIAVAAQRLCSVVSRWSTTHDAALVRLYAYLKAAGPMALAAEMAPDDIFDLELLMWPDADWAGDSEHTKSAGGVLVELHSPTSGRRWPLSRAVCKHASTAGSTAEAETVALSHNTKHEGIPTQMLLERMLGIDIPLVVLVDNTQAISAVTKGYSKKLKFLERTHKVSIGFLHELVVERGAMILKHAPTATHRGDGFTKAMSPARFMEARDLMGMIRTRLAVGSALAWLCGRRDRGRGPGPARWPSPAAPPGLARGFVGAAAAGRFAPVTGSAAGGRPRSPRPGTVGLGTEGDPVRSGTAGYILPSNPSLLDLPAHGCGIRPPAPPKPRPAPCCAGAPGGVARFLEVTLAGAAELDVDGLAPEACLFTATAHYPDEGAEAAASRMLEPVQASCPLRNSVNADCLLEGQIRVPFNSRQQFLKVGVYRRSAHRDVLVGEATVPFADPVAGQVGEWSLLRDFEEVGCISLSVSEPLDVPGAPTEEAALCAAAAAAPRPSSAAAARSGTTPLRCRRSARCATTCRCRRSPPALAHWREPPRSPRRQRRWWSPRRRRSRSGTRCRSGRGARGGGRPAW